MGPLVMFDRNLPICSFLAMDARIVKSRPTSVMTEKERRAIYGTSNIRRRQKETLSPLSSSTIKPTLDEKISLQRHHNEENRKQAYHLKPSSSDISSWLKRKRNEERQIKKSERSRRKQAERSDKLLREAKIDREDQSREQYKVWLQWKKDTKTNSVRFATYKH